MDPEQDQTNADLANAQQDVSDFLNGNPVGPKKATGPDAQAIAQAAQAYINSQKSRSGESSQDRQTRQLAVQAARDDYQTIRDSARAMEQSTLQGQKDEASAARQATRNATQLETAGIRGDATTGAATIRAGATTGAADIRAGASTESAGISAAGREQVAQTNAAARIAAIQQKAQADLAALDKKFEQNLQTLNANEGLKKDYYQFTSQLQIVRDEHLQQAMAIRQEAVAAQQQEFERPFREASAAAETQRAQTESERAAQEAKYQQASLQLGVAKDQATQAGSAIQSGVKLGVAPPMALVKAQFAPFQMAQEILKDLVSKGQIDPQRVPDALGLQAQPADTSGGQDQGAPQPTTQPPLGQFSGYGTPGGYQGAPPPNIFGSGTGDYGAPVPVGV